MLNFLRVDNMTFACEVESLRDDGYGKMKHYKKLGESLIRVVNNENPELIMKHDPSQGRTAAAGKPLKVTCVSKGADPSPKLSITIGGKNITTLYGGRLKQISSGRYGESGVEGIIHH